MSETVALPGTRSGPSAGAALVCRLRQKSVNGVRGPIPWAGELELENCSAGPVEIRYQMSPLQYLELVVTGPTGAVVSDGRFGDRFSPSREERALLLRPGEKFVGDVPLLGTVPPERRAPGAYQVRAVYEYQGIRAVSDPLEITV